MFGKGIADPADDLSRANHPSTRLLDALAKHFVAFEYDLKGLIRTIALSQRTGVVGDQSRATSRTPGCSPPDSPTLTAHQMADALGRRPTCPIGSPTGCHYACD